MDHAVESGDPENAKLAEDYLSTAGMWDRLRIGPKCASRLGMANAE
jgi:hypothetical protein